MNKINSLSGYFQAWWQFIFDSHVYKFVTVRNIPIVIVHHFIAYYLPYYTILLHCFVYHTVVDLRWISAVQLTTRPSLLVWVYERPIHLLSVCMLVNLMTKLLRVSSKYNPQISSLWKWFFRKLTTFSCSLNTISLFDRKITDLTRIILGLLAIFFTRAHFSQLYCYTIIGKKRDNFIFSKCVLLSQKNLIVKSYFI